MKLTEHIIKRCIKGDQKAQKILVEQSAPQLMRVALRYTHDEPTAKDVLQDSYLKIFKNIHSFDFSKGTVSAWMRRITINTAIEKYRRKYWKQEISLEQSNQAQNKYSYHKIDHLDVEKIYQLINELPMGYRTVFNLHVIEGYSHVEIGAMLDISDSTSRSQLNRARNILKEKLIQLEIV